MAKKTARSAASRATVKASTKKKPPIQKKQSVQSRRVFAEPRQLKLAQSSRFRLHKPIKHPVKLPNVWILTKKSADIIWQNKRLFLGIIIIYGLLNLIFVQGLSNSTDISSLKSSLGHVLTGSLGAFTSSLNVFLILLGSTGSSSSPTAAPYQFILGLTTSLAIIWALRHVLAGTKVSIRDAFYRGMYPLVPFILVLLVICIQLVPFVIGSLLYSTAMSGGIAVAVIEKLFWIVIFILLALWSLYMVSSSVFALYIVTLNDMTPIKALRSARQLVRHRRWSVLRKILCLPIILLIVAGIIMLPIIIILTPLAQWVFLLISMTALVAVHTYMYTLYRELLNE